jgi:hypothetical protein
MTPLEFIKADLEASGLEVTEAEAEAIAIRSSGSIDAYADFIRSTKKDLAELIEPAPGPVSTKWSDPVAYDIKPAAGE